MNFRVLFSTLLSVSLLFAASADKKETATPNQTLNTKESSGFSSYFTRQNLSREELDKRVLYTNIAATGAVVLWGVAFWDYFKANPQLGHEGWFGKDTHYGGADKFGHMYSTYLWSLGFASLYEYWGMDPEQSRIYGPLSGWMVQGLMELGDSFSDTQGFSYEDMVMNTAGAIFYYLREKYPSLKKKVDLRLEYLPDFSGKGDLFTQYNSMKYNFAIKFSGFDSLNKGILKYGELLVGYYTRGYQDHDHYAKRERVAYIGIGINLSEVFKKAGWEKTGKIFNYYQMPYSYVPFGHDFDSGKYVAPYSRPYHGYRF